MLAPRLKVNGRAFAHIRSSRGGSASSDSVSSLSVSGPIPMV